MLKLWMMRNKLPEYRSIEALSVQICKNICINKRKARKTVSDNSFDSLPTSSLTSDNQPENADSAEIVAQIIGTLPDMQKLIIRLRDIEGLQVGEIAEIAEITGCEESAVRMNLSRARKKVREIFFKLNNISMYHD
jgi:RNA polymerase sigma-70 factor (ECF subfamily)